MYYTKHIVCASCIAVSDNEFVVMFVHIWFMQAVHELCTTMLFVSEQICLSGCAGYIWKPVCRLYVVNVCVRACRACVHMCLCDGQSLISVWQPAVVSDALLAGQLSGPPHSATEPQEAGWGKDELTRWFNSLQRGRQAVAIILKCFGKHIYATHAYKVEGKGTNLKGGERNLQVFWDFGHDFSRRKLTKQKMLFVVTKLFFKQTELFFNYFLSNFV